ncbi:MAG: RNase H-like domain-containing protein, partial [Flavobacteriales bacterium]
MTAGNTNQKKAKNRVPRKVRKRAGAIRDLGSQKSLPSHWWNSKLVVVPPHVRDFVKAEKVRLRNNQESRRFERTDDQEEVLEALGDYAQAICEHLKKLLPNFKNSGVVTDEDKNLVNDALTACPHVNAISINNRTMVDLSGATQHVQNEYVRCRDIIELALKQYLWHFVGPKTLSILSAEFAKNPSITFVQILQEIFTLPKKIPDTLDPMNAIMAFIRHTGEGSIGMASRFATQIERLAKMGINWRVIAKLDELLAFILRRNLSPTEWGDFQKSDWNSLYLAGTVRLQLNAELEAAGKPPIPNDQPCHEEIKELPMKGSMVDRILGFISDQDAKKPSNYRPSMNREFNLGGMAMVGDFGWSNNAEMVVLKYLSQPTIGDKPFNPEEFPLGSSQSKLPNLVQPNPKGSNVNNFNVPGNNFKPKRHKNSKGERDRQSRLPVSQVLCRFHAQGKCQRGKECPFSHDLNNKNRGRNGNYNFNSSFKQARSYNKSKDKVMLNRIEAAKSKEEQAKFEKYKKFYNEHKRHKRKLESKSEGSNSVIRQVQKFAKWAGSLDKSSKPSKRGKQVVKYMHHMKKVPFATRVTKYLGLGNNPKTNGIDCTEAFNHIPIDLTVEATEPLPTILSFNQHIDQELAEASETECDSGMSDFDMANSGVCFMMHAPNSNNDDMTYAYAHIVKNNTVHRRRVVLDSGATTNLFKEGWATKSGGDPTVIQGLNGASPSGAAADALLVVGKSDVVMPGYISSQLPSNCVALLGRPAIRKLINEHDFDMNFHLKQPVDSCHDLSCNVAQNAHEAGTHKKPTRKPKRMREVWLKPPTLPRKLPKLRNRGKSWFCRDGPKFVDDTLLCSTPNVDSTEMALDQFPQLTPFPPHPSSKDEIQTSTPKSSKNEVCSAPEIETSELKSTSKSKHTVLISQKQMLKYLQRKPIKEDITNHVLQNQLAHQRVTINPDLPTEIKEKISALLEQHKRAFQTTDTGLCKPLNVPPVIFKMKANAKQVRVKQQRFNPATELLATHLTRQHLKSGLLEDAHKSSWCSRTHFALKAASGERLDGPNHKVRECGDYREVNDQIEKMVTNVPDGPMMVRNVARFSHFIETDWHTAYNALLVAENNRDILARHTPLGPMRPTRLQFGIKNAQALFYGAKLHIYNRDLKQDTRDNLFSFIDDDRSGKTAEEGWDKFLCRLEDLLKCMVQNDATLRPEKTRIGFTSTEFFGHEITNHKTRVARKNLLPVEQMQTPTCVGDIRRVLGVFVQSKDHVENYSTVIKPLSMLLRKSAKFVWGKEQEQSFESMRKILLSRPWLHVVDYKKQLHLDVDASQYAMGACLYQINEKGEKNIILFASKAFDDERGKTFTTASPFYREARAVAHFMKEVRNFTALSPFKLLVHSDHLPLTWMKLSKRSTICDFVLFDMGGMDYEILYKPGKSNIVADALSRFPMIGPNKFHLKGLVQ